MGRRGWVWDYSILTNLLFICGENGEARWEVCREELLGAVFSFDVHLLICWSVIFYLTDAGRKVKDTYGIPFCQA